MGKSMADLHLVASMELICLQTSVSTDHASNGILIPMYMGSLASECILPVSCETAMRLSQNLLTATQFMHTCGVVHSGTTAYPVVLCRIIDNFRAIFIVLFICRIFLTDIKPGNCFIRVDGLIDLADYGSCAKIGEVFSFLSFRIANKSSIYFLILSSLAMSGPINIHDRVLSLVNPWPIQTTIFGRCWSLVCK
jgi:serine/threonine protein kinase